jgi:DNA-nicking Smr family endonuclease
MKGRGKSIRHEGLPQRSIEEDMPKLDLHGKDAIEAEYALEEFLKENIEAGTERVNVVFGTSGHVLRDITQRILRKFRKKIQSSSPYGPGTYIKFLKP